MSSFFEAAKQKIGQAYCGVSDFSVWYASQAAELLDTSPVGGLAEAQKQIFTYWNQLACGVDPSTPLPASFDAPFSGGQCEGATYQYYCKAQATLTNGASYLVEGFLVGIPGKISSMDILINPANNKRVMARSTSSDGTVKTVNLDPGFGIAVTGVSNKEFIYQSGLNNCGDISAELTPTNQPFTDTTNVDYTDENGNPQTAQNVSFTYGLPFVEPDGTISVPYEVCYDGFCFKGKTNFGDSLKVIPEPPLKAPIEESPACPTIEDIEALLNSADRTDEILEKIQEVLDKIEELPEPTLYVPDDWAIKIEGDRPQLIAGMQDAATAGQGSASKWQIVIPRPLPNIESFSWEQLAEYFPDYSRGKYGARVRLKDNSVMAIRANSRTAAKQYLTKMLELVDPTYRPNEDEFVYGENSKYQTVAVTCRGIGYYATGRRQGEKPTKRWYYPAVDE